MGIEIEKNFLQRIKCYAIKIFLNVGFFHSTENETLKMKKTFCIYLNPCHYLFRLLNS